MDLTPESINQNSNNKNTDNVQTRASIKEKLEKKRQELKSNKKVKNPYFVKTCKILLYLISLISLFIVIKKLLEYFGLIEMTTEANNKSSTVNNNNSINKDHVPLKQVELSENKQHTDKNK